MKEIFPGVFKISGKLVTRNATPGKRVYGEKLLRYNGVEYRVWDPHRSKLAAALLNGLKYWSIDKNTNILYLGASSGTTISHLTDITSGFVYGVEMSHRMMRELLPLSEVRNTIIPILADASFPHRYCHLVGKIEVILSLIHI